MSNTKEQSVGSLLKEYRKAEGLVMRKAAALADMDPSALSRIENGRRLPTASQLAVLAEIYGRPLDSLQAVLSYSEIKEKYGQSEHFEKTLQLLNEDAAHYGDH